MALIPPTPALTVTVVEDDEDTRVNVCSFLQKAGLRVWGAESAEHFYVRLLQEKTDLVVVDLGLPGQDGLNLIRILSEQNVPVIALTGRGDSVSRIQGLNAGALQYFVKPADMNELFAGIRSQLRYMKSHVSAIPTRESENRLAQVPMAWRLDRHASQLIGPDQSAVRLTGSEFELMHCLMSAGGAIVSKSELVRQMGYTDDEDGIHGVESHLARVRRKTLLETGSALPVRAIFGKGLVFLH
ncbi:response regulator transcription factor [Diaphorobacter sp. HDW4A]|uniref:response regulator transcription factor n=1 Tax=Diaphorobacter sp. HDW4A TaxID=2714924 RepID=UPI001408BCC4|nr:response regulator transcription factor [Diaphorobacter sp. HDW4A]QIL81513.1 response regulator transcription factor [Diaphorobacter sp. HDW4A]